MSRFMSRKNDKRYWKYFRDAFYKIRKEQARGEIEFTLVDEVFVILLTRVKGGLYITRVTLCAYCRRILQVSLNGASLPHYLPLFRLQRLLQSPPLRVQRRLFSRRLQVPRTILLDGFCSRDSYLNNGGSSVQMPRIMYLAP